MIEIQGPVEHNALGEPRPPFRWSFSQWENYDGCPARWKYKSILKLPGSPPGPAAARGLDMHDRVEKYIKGDTTLEYMLNGEEGKLFGDKRPARVHPKYIPILDAYRNHENGDVGAERKVAFDPGWFVCAPVSRFASCIAVVDAWRYGGKRGSYESENRILEIGEWKSGKPKDTHADQRKLYAMFGLRLWLAYEVRVTTYYLEDTADPVRLVVRSDAGHFEKLKSIWQPRIDLMQRDQICAPKPGMHCRWCDYAASKGGPCVFGN